MTHREPTSYNNRKKDAQLLYMIGFASSRLPQALEQSTFVSVNRDDFFANHVICHARRVSRGSCR